MNRNSWVGVFLLILLVAQGSNASMFSKIRKLVAVTPPEVNGTQISPSPAPITAETLPSLDNSTSMIPSSDNSTSVIPSLDNSTAVPQKPPAANNPPEIDQKGHVKLPDTPQNETPMEKDYNQDATDEKCELPGNSCIQGDMVACLMRSEEGPQDLLILIQNEGESLLNISVTVPASVQVLTKELLIPKHRAKKINASSNVGEPQKIVLNAGQGDCVLQTGVPITEDTFFQRIPYHEHVTPMHGVYVTFVVVLSIGGIWACCKFGKRDRHDGGGSGGGVQYQELEMTLPESSPPPAGNGGGENGWDQGWDDDWDEERAIKSPGKRVGNSSSNGWENDWDE